MPRPQLPVIPLPLPIEAFEQPAPAAEAKRALGLPESCAVVLWLGRLSLLTKVGSLAHISDFGTGGPTFEAATGFGGMWP